MSSITEDRGPTTEDKRGSSISVFSRLSCVLSSPHKNDKQTRKRHGRQGRSVRNPGWPPGAAFVLTLAPQLLHPLFSRHHVRCCGFCAVRCGFAANRP